jgi:hypothetical protein
MLFISDLRYFHATIPLDRGLFRPWKQRPGASAALCSKVHERNRKCGVSLGRNQIDAHRSITDPLVHHGRHFGQVTHSFCNITALLTNGLLYMSDPEANPMETTT